MLCTFHGIWMAFKKDLLPLPDVCQYGKLYGKYTICCMNSTFEFIYATKFVLQIYNVNLYAERNLLYKWLWLKSYVQIHVHR